VDHTDFVHLVQLGEQARADDGKAYRRRVAAFAALGYAWTLGGLALAVGILGWVLPQLQQGRFRLWLLWWLLGATGLLWTSLRALWARLDPPDGVLLTADQAPALFKALARVRRKVHGPRLHGVYLSDEFNASIRQEPRFGLLGGSANQLVIGLPLLLALDRSRLLAVLAHEYGHLRGGQDRFSSWIYRTRLSWQRLHRSLRRDDSSVAAVTQAFLRWYFPRFAARTFALARQDEYEADHVAAGLLGPEVMASALTEIEIKRAWLRDEFWAGHWRGAAARALPIGPYQAMLGKLTLPPPPVFAQNALREALGRRSGLDDTHPVLRERLKALGEQPGLPPWSRRGSLDLLGTMAGHWLAHFDKQWCSDHAADWKLHHAWLTRMRERVRTLTVMASSRNAHESVELANLMRSLDPHAEVRPLYEAALERSFDHPGALRGLAQSLASDRGAKLDCLQRLWDASSTDRWWAARTAMAELETPRPGMSHDAAALKLWRERLKQAQEVEERAWEELSAMPYFSNIARHDLSDFELGELWAELARCQPVACCWLVRKNLREFPQRRAYLVFVELPDMEDEDRYHLCRSLEHSLSLPGQALVLWAGTSPTREEILGAAFEPLFTR